MKFTGLILICAASCLALILPAIGVVQFPKVQSNRVQSNIPSTTAAPQWNSPTWSPPNSTGNTNFATNGSYPISTNTSPILSQTIPNDQGFNPTETAVPGNKFGLGIWLLLIPVCLLGLAMWTFGPNPSGPKPRFGKG